MKLRQLNFTDVEGMLEWMHEPTIYQNFRTDFSSYNSEQVKKFISDSFTETNRHYACVNESDQYLGTVSLKNIDHNSQNAEYAISFRKNAHGTGASYFATNQILKIAFYELNLEKVYLNVISKNIRAISFYEKYGFTFEGCFKKHISINGILEDLMWYRILKNEYIRGIKNEKDTIRDI